MMASFPQRMPELESPTAMTIAIVGELATRHGTADMVAQLAGLACADELVVVYGCDEYRPGADVHAIVMGLRQQLPRHTVVVLYADPHNRPLRREAGLLDELLELGSLPIVVTPPTAVLNAAAELYHHLRADRVVEVLGGRRISGLVPAFEVAAA